MERQQHAGQTDGQHHRSRISLTLNPGYNNLQRQKDLLREDIMRIPRRAVLGFLAIGTLALAPLTNSQAQQAPATLFIRGATIIDGLADQPLRDRALLIEGNTIRGLLPA